MTIPEVGKEYECFIKKMKYADIIVNSVTKLSKCSKELIKLWNNSKQSLKYISDDTNFIIVECSIKEDDRCKLYFSRSVKMEWVCFSSFDDFIDRYGLLIIKLNNTSFKKQPVYSDIQLGIIATKYAIVVKNGYVGSFERWFSNTIKEKE